MHPAEETATEDTGSPPPSPPGSRWTSGRVASVVVGSILSLVGVGVLAGGGVLTWAAATQRDDAGYFHADAERFSSPAYAVTSDDLDLGTDSGPGDGNLQVGDLLRSRLATTSADPESPVFVGIARTSDVEAYLGGVAHDVVRDVDTDPFVVDYEAVPGDTAPVRPDSQDFWVASSVGTSRQTVVWEPGDGRWTAVLMNADASRSVAADIEVGVEVKHLWLIFGGLLGFGALVGATGVVLIVVGARRAKA
jgi:hypothetical protein